MKKFIYKISTKTKNEIKDPKGEVVENIVSRLDIATSIKISTGKYYEITLFEKDKKTADEKINLIAKNILTNPLVETYHVESAVE